MSTYTCHFSTGIVSKIRCSRPASQRRPIRIHLPPCMRHWLFGRFESFTWWNWIASLLWFNQVQMVKKSFQQRPELGTSSSLGHWHLRLRLPKYQKDSVQSYSWANLNSTRQLWKRDKLVDFWLSHPDIKSSLDPGFTQYRGGRRVCFPCSIGVK